MTANGTDPSPGPTRLRVGVVTPHAAPGPEVELPAMTSGRVATVVARIVPPGSDPATAPPTTAAPLRALTDGPALDRAAAAIRDALVDAVVHASTSTSYALGARDEAELVERLAARCRAPVVASGAATVTALRRCGSRRVALVHPPWFAPEIDALGIRYFGDQGFDAVLAKATGLLADPGPVRPEQVVAEVVRHLDDEADAVYLGGNGFRTTAAIEELERRTGRLVLTANQVLLWSLLTGPRAGWSITGYGRLFRTPPSAPD